MNTPIYIGVTDADWYRFHLRKGAANNAVQITELLAKHKG